MAYSSGKRTFLPEERHLPAPKRRGFEPESGIPSKGKRILAEGCRVVIQEISNAALKFRGRGSETSDMPYITEERTDTVFNTDCATYVANATANKTTLGITTEQLEAMEAIFTTYSDALTAASEAKAAARAAVASKNAAKEAARDEVVKWAKVWRANQSIPDSVLADLMLPPHSTPGTKTPPTTPTDLTFTITPEGVVQLKWKRNGNNSSTVFNVEGSANGTNGWTVVGTTTKSKIPLAGAPGTTWYLRVVAIRGGQYATPTNPVVVWPGESSSETLALAA